MRFSHFLTGTALALALPAGAMATQATGPYFSLGGGYNLKPDVDVSSRPGGNGKIDIDNGVTKNWVFGSAVGWKWENGLRAELQVYDWKSKVDGRSAGGKNTTLAPMVTRIHDITQGRT